MYNKGSTEFNELINKVGGNALITRFRFPNFTIEKFTKLEYYGGSNSSDNIAIGTTNMAYLDVGIITDNVIANQEFLFEVGMELSDKTIEYAPMGYFTVQRPDSDEDSVNFKAYDRMQKFEKPYISSLAYPTDSSQILNELCTMCGVELATPIANPITITDKLDGYTCREVLGYIAGIHGFFACFDRYGKLNLRWYSETPIEKQIGLIWSLTKAQSDYRVEKITLAKDSETTYTSGTGISGINYSNPYATQGIADSIYAKLNGFTYRPCEISMLDDIRLDPWDMLRVTYLDGSVLTIPIMSLSHSFTNGETKVKSFGKTDTENEYNYSGPVTQAMDRMATELLVANRIIATKVDAEWVKANTITTEEADINYAKIDFSNVGTQVVSSSMIKDGAVTNEKVGNLSANKITSGTIDASKITVTNLNADNLTVGTINGKLIGNGSVDLNKLSQEVPTKEYLDNVQKDLQGQIDGAIETFTKSEIPTLNNEPASLWTDNETRKKHIGDVCYVLNPTSSADGYCYRFANIGTEASPSYEWVLIKDSDVTKALQDIIDINGEITGIKQFDTEISSWKTETDSELSILKSRTTKLEIDIGTKVETSVFNELKQTVDENSSSITSLSTTVSQKADSSTVTDLTNTVNSVKQTADTNTSSISSMQTTISNKADSSTVTALSNKTSELEQSLNGFKTTVSETYTTKTEFNNLEIGGRNLLIYSTARNAWHTNFKADYNTGIISGKGSYYIRFNGDFKPNTTYTISVESVTNEGAYSGFLDVKYYDLSNNINLQYIGLLRPGTPITFRTNGNVNESSDLLICVSSSGVVDYEIVNLKLEKGNKATDWTPAPEDVETEITSVQTIATQTADKFNWLVKSGTSATDFTLTDRMAELTAEIISLNGNVKVNGDMIVDGTIGASKINVKDLFSENIMVENGSIDYKSEYNQINFNYGISREFDGEQIFIPSSSLSTIRDYFHAKIDSEGISIVAESNNIGCFLNIEGISKYVIKNNILTKPNVISFYENGQVGISDLDCENGFIGNFSSDKVSIANEIKMMNSHAWTVNYFGNFKHNGTNANDYLNFLSNSGEKAMKYYWEQGNLIVPNDVRLENGNSLNDSIFDITTYGSENIFRPTLQTTTTNGVSLRRNDNGTYTLYGTATARTSFELFGAYGTVGGGTFGNFSGKKFFCVPSNTGLSVENLAWDSNWATLVNQTDTGNGFTFSYNPNGTHYAIRLIVPPNIFYNYVLIKPSISSNFSLDYDNFKPYYDDLGSLTEKVRLLTTMVTELSN